MTCQILINNPGDGDWIMRRVGGVFNDRTDHTVAVHREGSIRGGVVYTGFMGASIMLHMAGTEGNWATRDFLWMVFDYAFNQLGCRKLMGAVAARNARAIHVDLRLGFRLEARLTGMLPDPDEDLFILTMDRAACRWLTIKPKIYQRGTDTIKWVA
jgi:L-amino acid N-acyltransferase YncA